MRNSIEKVHLKCPSQGDLLVWVVFVSLPPSSANRNELNKLVDSLMPQATYVILNRFYGFMVCYDHEDDAMMLFLSLEE